jgi:hypothetical protein
MLRFGVSGHRHGVGSTGDGSGSPRLQASRCDIRIEAATKAMAA